MIGDNYVYPKFVRIAYLFHVGTSTISGDDKLRTLLFELLKCVCIQPTALMESMRNEEVQRSLCIF